MSLSRSSASPSGTPVVRWLSRLVVIENQEASILLWSFGYFFSLLCSYYILRPLRDEMGITGGVDQLQWLFTGTFLAMLAAFPLFGFASARLPRKKLLPGVYLFFILNILLFFVLFRNIPDPTWIARSFFIWTSVFNLFVVSIFWSFMADIFSNAQAKRLFAFIAAGGTLGAIAGPALTAGLVIPMGTLNLLPLSALLLCGSLVCIQRLSRLTPDAPDQKAPLGGGVFQGARLVAGSRYLIAICLFIWLYTTLATVLYFEQAHIVKAAFQDSARRTALFAGIDLAVNLLTILFQLAVTGRLIGRFGLPAVLASVPVLLGVGFLFLALAPLLPVLLLVQVSRRAGNYAITRPAREVLFTVVDRTAKYKAKNFIDTVVYRGGDAVSAWFFSGLKALGLGLTGIALVAVPLALVWAFAGYKLGRWQEVLKNRGGESP